MNILKTTEAIGMSFFKFIFIISVPIFMCHALNRAPWVEPAESLMSETGQQLASKYGMQMIGSGGAMFDGINSLSISFRVCKPLEKDQARQLIVSCANEFISNINSDSTIYKYLVNKPANECSVEIRIFIVSENGEKVFHPAIGIVSLIGGQVKYKTYYPDGRYGYKSITKESFQEASQKNRSSNFVDYPIRVSKLVPSSLRASAINYCSTNDIVPKLDPN